MTDPTVAYLPGEGCAPYNNRKTLDVWLKAETVEAKVWVSSGLN